MWVYNSGTASIKVAYLQVKFRQGRQARKEAPIDGFEVIIIQPQSLEFWHTSKGRSINGTNVVIIQVEICQSNIVTEVSGLYHT